MERVHQTVMCQEAVEALNIDPDATYIDATYGRGGHSKAILAKLSTKGRLVVIDQDPTAIEHAKASFAEDDRVEVVQASFATLFDVLSAIIKQQAIKGILFDLGVSSPQLDDAERGFSFRQDGPLDMRMDTSSGISAADWLAEVDEKTLAKVLREYGEERFAKGIARAIVSRRAEIPLERTKQLAELIREATPKIDPNKHPATRSFQAIRIFVNQELTALSDALMQCLELLSIGGRLVVISFHSLEDRIVKRFMRDAARGEQLPRGLAVKHQALNCRLKIVAKASKPSMSEVKQNPRARSAVLRVAEKIA